MTSLHYAHLIGAQSTSRRIGHRHTTIAAIIAALAGFSSGVAAQCQPDIAGSIDPPDSNPMVVYGVAVSGNTAYVGTHFGLVLYDLTYPTSPTYISQFGVWDGPQMEPTHLVASDTTVFAADLHNEIFRSFDVSDPQNPAALDSLAFDIGFNGGMARSGDIVFAAGGTAVRIVDASDPANLSFVTSIGQPHLGNAQDVAAAGDLIYIAAGGAGLLIFDVSDPANPALLGSLSTLGDAEGVAVEGDVAYVADDSDDTLNLIDVADPMNPTLIGSVSTDIDGALTHPRGDVVVENGTVFLATNYQGSGLNLAAQSFDVNDPAEPTLNGIVVTDPDTIAQLARHGPFTFIATEHFDFESPPALVLRDPCYAGYGGCCVGDGCLQLMTESDCANVGGTFLGAGASCADADCSDPEPACPADLTADGLVNGADLGILLSEWGSCPE